MIETRVEQLEPLVIRNLLKYSLAVYIENFVPILKISLLLVIVPACIAQLSFVFGSLVGLLAQSVLLIIVSYISISYLGGDRIGVRAALAIIEKKAGYMPVFVGFVSCILVPLLMFVVYLISPVVTLASFVDYLILLMIFPVIYLLVGLSVVFPTAAIELKGVRDSFVRSFVLTRGNRWRILGIFVVVGIGASIIQLTVKSLVFSALPALEEIELFSIIIDAFFSVLFLGFYGCVVALIYCTLRSSLEGWSPTEFATKFQ